jgi:hypothetical protein
MDGFVRMVREALISANCPDASIHTSVRLELPGWFRPEKRWDLVVVHEGRLLAAMEFKSQGSSFGNNFNNRTEEAIGSATDLWASFREGAFAPSPRPWLGYLMLLENSGASSKPVKAKEPHFKTFPEFRSASYAQRYEILLKKLVRDRLYDAACLVLSPQPQGRKATYSEPDEELSLAPLVRSLQSLVAAL